MLNNFSRRVLLQKLDARDLQCVLIGYIQGVK